jgi:hypothetical protein
MASVGSVTRQIAALEISSKQNGVTKSAPTGHVKKGSQNGQNVSKLLSKFAQPNPFPPGIQKATSSNSSSSIASKVTRPASPAKPPPAPKPVAPQEAQPKVDIGRYDGGFEIDNETRGEKVHGEAAEHLALDSSIAR